MTAAALRAGRWIRWYVKELTGEAKWDEYLERCRSAEITPVSRREFERHRADHMENNPQARCC